MAQPPMNSQPNLNLNHQQEVPRLLATLMEQMARQSDAIDRLTQAQQQQEPVDVDIQDTAQHVHDLPIRPSYDWSPEPELFHFIPSLDGPILTNTLSEEERKAIIEMYPPIRGLSYTPPAALEPPGSKASNGQRREDGCLRSLQYLISGILRPLDVLAHVCFTELPEEQAVRVLTMLNHTRTLVLNAYATANTSRNEVAMRAVNPAYSLPSTKGKEYTMDPTQFQEAITQQSAMLKAFRDAKPRGTGNKQQFFRGPPTQGGGGPAESNFQRPYNNNNNQPFRRQDNNGYNNNNNNNGNGNGNGNKPRQNFRKNGNRQ
jgi:hypothetical protein